MTLRLPTLLGSELGHVQAALIRPVRGEVLSDPFPGLNSPPIAP